MMTAPFGSMGNDVFTPHHGTYVFEYVAGPVGPHSVTLKGPTDNQPFAAQHMGWFAVPGIGQVTVEAQFNSDSPFVVDVYARWAIHDQHKVLVKGPVDLLAGGYNCNDGQWNAIDLTRGNVNYSHWRPRFLFSKSIDEDGSRVPLDSGTSILIDCMYVPDNGQPVSFQPYLDGDQPEAHWEGTAHLSSSIWDYESNSALVPFAPVIPVLPETIVL